MAVLLLSFDPPLNARGLWRRLARQIKDKEGADALEHARYALEKVVPRVAPSRPLCPASPEFFPVASSLRRRQLLARSPCALPDRA